MERTVKINILKFRKGIGKPPNRPSGRRRFCAVRVFCLRQNTRTAQAEFISSEHFKPKGGSRLWPAKPKKKDMTKGHVFLFGARGGSRTRTPLRALAPEASESTNSTTRASYFVCAAQRKRYISTAARFCQHFFVFFRRFFLDPKTQGTVPFPGRPGM